MRRMPFLVAVLALLVGAFVLRGRINSAVTPVILRLKGQKTVGDRMRELGPAARERWSPFFERAGASYPPRRLVLVGLKRERRLDVYAGEGDGRCRFMRSYPVLGASGGPGPKLQEGDGQVPEGIYRVEALNPNSQFHLSLRIGYPSEFDRRMASREGRQRLGSDIMIHGGIGSVGCLAMGDEAAEELFILAADTGIRNVRVILSPRDLRRPISPAALPNQPDWVGSLYQEIRAELEQLPPPSGRAGPQSSPPGGGP